MRSSIGHVTSGLERSIVKPAAKSQRDNSTKKNMQPSVSWIVNSDRCPGRRDGRRGAVCTTKGTCWRDEPENNDAGGDVDGVLFGEVDSENGRYISAAATRAHTSVKRVKIWQTAKRRFLLMALYRTTALVYPVDVESSIEYFAAGYLGDGAKIPGMLTAKATKSLFGPIIESKTWWCLVLMLVLVW